VLSNMWHPLRYAALAAVTTSACSLSLLGIAQARPAGNPSTVHKRHLNREPYFGHLTGPANAWVSGRCDGTYQSQFPPFISAVLGALTALSRRLVIPARLSMTK
jgi:hypothetical protein